MHSQIFSLYILAAVSVLPLAFLASESDDSQKFLGKYDIPNKKTNGPIDIDTEEVEMESNLLSLELLFDVTADLKVENTGKLVQAILTEEQSYSNLTGGVFDRDAYIFKKIKYLWVKNTRREIAGSSINENGFPLEVILIFYNKKYKTFEKALEHRDGLAELDYPIHIGENENDEFDEYSETLKEIKTSGSSETTILGTSIRWFANLPEESTYYAYPGSYVDEETGKRYYCSTVILFRHVGFLSQEQFDDTFGSFENPSGMALSNKESQFPREGRPVVEAKEVDTQLS